jgi:hypothetical protein
MKSSLTWEKAENYKQRKGLPSWQRDDSVCWRVLKPLFFKQEGRIMKKL